MRIILIVFCLIPFLIYAQTPEETIREMKDGIVLVRLKSKNKTIKALTDSGQESKAELIKDQQKEENLEITGAFKENFEFCPVHYFYDFNTQEIKDKEYGSIVLDENLDPIEDFVLPDNQRLFIIEFGQIEASDEKYFTHYTLEESPDGEKEIRTNYGGDTEIGASALVIRDGEFRQLQKPFPFYIRTREGLPWSRSKSKTVKKMNDNLHRYYSSLK